MNIAAILGTLTGIAITAFAILTSAKNPAVFKDTHGIVIVLGGTFTVALLSFPFQRLKDAISILFRKMFGRRRNDFLLVIRTIVNTAEAYRKNPKSALDGLPKDMHPFFMDGMKMLVEYGFSYEDLDAVLSNALNGKKKRDEQEVKVWHTASRFPPAFGLLGATVGMISLLQTLGEPGAQDRVGPAMATALVATFYGLVTANFFLIPIAENLGELSSEDLILRKIIKEGILLIHEKRHPTFIEEYLKSFLPPKVRGMELSGQGGNGGAKAA